MTAGSHVLELQPVSLPPSSSPAASKIQNVTSWKCFHVADKSQVVN